MELIIPAITYTGTVKIKTGKCIHTPGFDLVLPIKQDLLITRILRVFRPFSYQVNLRLRNWS